MQNITIQAIWEFEADITDINPNQVNTEKLAVELTQKELDYQIKHHNITANDFHYQIKEPSDKQVSKQQILDIAYPLLNSIQPASIEYQYLYTIIQAIKQL